ncbi:MAG: hypothetical protein KKD35_01735 [Elusimicrobia bacterium]|nr:hypothetical protein [Elusimicrobiota bacterium]
MDRKIKITLIYIQELTKNWKKITSATEAANTSLLEFIKQKKTGCSMKAMFAKFLLELLGYRVKIVRGYYLSPERWVLHSWIKINEKEYDPSRKDFKITKNHSRIKHDKKIKSWRQILKLKRG